MAIELSDDLIRLERTAWAEQQAGALTVESAAAVQLAVTAHAEATGQGTVRSRDGAQAARPAQGLTAASPAPTALSIGAGRQRCSHSGECVGVHGTRRH